MGKQREQPFERTTENLGGARSGGIENFVMRPQKEGDLVRAAFVALLGMVRGPKPFRDPRAAVAASSNEVLGFLNTHRNGGLEASAKIYWKAGIQHSNSETCIQQRPNQIVQCQIEFMEIHMSRGIGADSSVRMRIVMSR